MLSKKELDILILISDYSFISNKALINIFGGKKSNLSIYTKKLKVRGFIESIKDQGTTVWFLTKKSCGILEALNEHFFRPELKDDYDPAMLNHNTSLANIELAFNYPKTKDTKVEEYVSDRYLKRRFAKNKSTILREGQGNIRVPDAEFLYKEKYQIAIELELTKKAKYRYEKIFYFFRYYTYYDSVFWVFQTDSVMGYVKKVFKDIHLKSKERILSSPNGDISLLERDLSIHKFLYYDDLIRLGTDVKMVTLKGCF
jgi:DNA-binding MarR family transcriptional regulator